MPEANDSEMMQLPPDAATSSDNQNPRRRGQVQCEGEVGILITPEEWDSLEKLVLAEDVMRDILSGLRSIERRVELEAVFRLSQVQPLSGRCILNFHGEPGTGKTRAARAIARRLGKRLYQVDYSAIISKYLGDTAKHIVQAFKRAKELNAVLFFDEADSLLSRRIPMGESCATSINQNRNVLMQELDRFDGVVIVTTNLFENYDLALLRRVSKHIKFALPNRAMRVKLLVAHLPNPDRVDADLNSVAVAAQGLSGGDILNVCVNAMFAASEAEDSASWRVTQAMLMSEIAKIKTAKEDHTTRNTNN
jgi:ATP-dependent 26S proteasome regulatory subunit